jgi:hypothetical protein
MAYWSRPKIVNVIFNPHENECEHATNHPLARLFFQANWLLHELDLDAREIVLAIDMAHAHPGCRPSDGSPASLGQSPQLEEWFDVLAIAIMISHEAREYGATVFRSQMREVRFTADILGVMVYQPLLVWSENQYVVKSKAHQSV